MGLLLQWLLLFGQPAQAGLFDSVNPFAASEGPLDVERAFVFSARQLDAASVQLRWDIPDGYYLYRDRIEVTSGGQVEVRDRVNAPAEEKDDPLFGKVWVYHNQAQVDFTLASLGAGPANDLLSVTYQGCWEGGICYPPVTKEVPVAAVPVASTVAPLLRGEKSPVLAAAAVPAQESEQDRFARMLGEGGLLLTLGAFLLAGLALSLTPCVFPMIPILSSIIAGQKGAVGARHGFLLSLVYVLAVSVTYTLAGIFAGLFGENLQAMFQNPWIIGTFSGLFVLLALSMFGFYQLQLPTAWQERLNRVSRRQRGGTLTGVAVMGFLSALIVGPCMAAPLAGALIYIGQSGDPVLGGAALFALSLGMGVPLLLVGASAGKLLPKAGRWMVAVKAGFGVMLLLLAVWMLDRIVATEVTMVLTGVVLIASAVYMRALDRLEVHVSGWVKLWKGVGVIALIYGSALLLGALAGNRSMLYPLQGVAGSPVAVQQALPFETVTSSQQLEPLLVQAKLQGQPVMLDFYADWCISCVELEVVTFADAGVKKALRQFKLIKVDVTANDAAAKALNREYGVIGPPALIFYDAEGRLRKDMTFIGVADPQAFIQHLGRVAL